MATEPQILSSFSPRACPRCMLTCFSAGDREPSTNQLLFMQNKPNFPKSQMNVNQYNTKNYEKFLPLAGQKNKPNSNPISSKAKIACQKTRPHTPFKVSCFFLDPNIKEPIVIFYKYVIIRNSLKKIIILKGH